MRGRFVGGPMDGKVRDDTGGAHHFVVPIRQPESMTSDRAKELLSMHPDDLPPPTFLRAIYNHSLERDEGRVIIGYIYTYDRTEP